MMRFIDLISLTCVEQQQKQPINRRKKYDQTLNINILLQINVGKMPYFVQKLVCILQAPGINYMQHNKTLGHEDKTPNERFASKFITTSISQTVGFFNKKSGLTFYSSLEKYSDVKHRKPVQFICLSQLSVSLSGSLKRSLYC